MPQVTLYLDEETDARARAAAKTSGLSYSRWVAELIRSRTREEWPAAVRALAGSVPDFPDSNELRASAGRDVSRESLG